ncbi:MAG: sulfopyruvate decarboxylase subunit alpha [Chlamydiae bacterium]|nr:sulfopyruvate decarboxylase subunit alpha [Chlamydiota bacterium]MBI3277259.1 sulfopyruvate decarboxylase subunit alpha [Chlamydiota bacterium]
MIDLKCSKLAHDFWQKLKIKGFNFFTGVPCSFLEDLIRCISTHEDYLPAVREDSAMGVAVGAYLGGKKPVLLMQNSGLGVSYNALTSLNLIYKLPVLMLISLRGYQIKDAPEHWVMGEITPHLLDTIKIPYRIPSPESLGEDLKFCIDEMNRGQIPAALLMRKGIFGGQ